MTKAEAARQKKEARLQSEIERVEKMRAFEREIVQRAGGSGLICGIDEAGRGPLAGPVAAAAVTAAAVAISKLQGHLTAGCP